MQQTGDQNAVSQTDTHTAPFPSEEVGRQLEFFAEISQQHVKTKKSKVHEVRARHASPLDPTARQDARVKRLMLAGVLALLYLLVIAIFYLQDLITLRVLQANAVLIGTVFLLFRICFALGINLKIQGKNLRLPMTVASIGIMLYTVYISPITHIAFISFLFLVMAFVMHRLSPREVLFIAGATLFGYALVVASHYATRTDSAMLTL